MNSTICGRSFSIMVLSLAFLSPRIAMSDPTIETVLGPVPAAQLGLALEHEHVLVDFIGAEEVSPDRYDRDVVFAVALPYLEAAAAHGVNAIFECTPDFLARDPILLRRLSQASGLHLVTNTGLYGAADDKYLPPYAFDETAEDLAARWTAEACHGIEGTGIRPGFIKCGVDRNPVLSPVDRKLMQAAALTHRETGLTIAVHTGPGPGLEILEVLASFNVSPKAFIWVHAQSAQDAAILEAARRGAWISLDGVRPKLLERNAEALDRLKANGLLDQALLSHDAGWYDPDLPGGGSYDGYELLFTDFIPLLRERGFTNDEISQILVTNVARAFSQGPQLIEPANKP